MYTLLGMFKAHSTHSISVSCLTASVWWSVESIDSKTSIVTQLVFGFFIFRVEVNLTKL